MDSSFGFAQQPALPTKFTIPKKKQKIDENGTGGSRHAPQRVEAPPVWKLTRADKGSVLYSDFMKKVKFSEERAKLCFKIANLQMIQSTVLEKRFEQFKKKLKVMKLTEQESICYRIVFNKDMTKTISQKGLSTGSSFYSDLGNTNHGVYLMNNPDLVSAAPLVANTPLTIMAFRVMKGGRVGRVGLGSYGLEPSRTSVVHEPTGSGRAKKTETWRLKKYRMNQTFCYEIDTNTDEVIRIPSGVLPFAVFDLIPDTSKPFFGSCGIIPDVMERPLFTWTPRSGIMRREELEIHTFMEDQCKPTFLIKNVGFDRYAKMAAVSSHPAVQKLLQDEETWGRLHEEEEIPIYERDGENNIVLKFCVAAYYMKNRHRGFDTFVHTMRAKRLCLMGKGFEGGLILALPPSEFSFRLGLPLLKDPVLYLLVIKEHSIFDVNENVLCWEIKDKVNIGTGGCQAPSSKAMRNQAKMKKIYEEILIKEKRTRPVPKTVRERQQEELAREEEQRNLLANGRFDEGCEPDRPGYRNLLCPYEDPEDKIESWDPTIVPEFISAPPTKELKNLLKIDYSKNFIPIPIKEKKKVVWNTVLCEYNDGSDYVPKTNDDDKESNWSKEHGGAKFSDIRRKEVNHEFKKQLPQNEASQIFRDAMSKDGSNNDAASAELSEFQDPTIQKKPTSPPVVNLVGQRDLEPARFPTHFNYQQQRPPGYPGPPVSGHEFDRRQDHQNRYQDQRLVNGQDYRRQEYPERRSDYSDRRQAYQDHRHHDHRSNDYRSGERRDERDYRRDDRRRDDYRRPEERNDHYRRDDGGYRRHDDRQSERSNGGGRLPPLPVINDRFRNNRQQQQEYTASSPEPLPPYTPQSPEQMEFHHTQNNDLVDMDIDSDPIKEDETEEPMDIDTGPTDDPYDKDYDAQFGGMDAPVDVKEEEEQQVEKEEDKYSVEDEEKEELPPVAPAGSNLPNNDLLRSLLGVLTNNNPALNISLPSISNSIEEVPPPASPTAPASPPPPASPDHSAPSAPVNIDTRDLQRILDSVSAPTKDVDLRSSKSVGDVDLRSSKPEVPRMIRTIPNINFGLKKQEALLLDKSKFHSAFSGSNEDDEEDVSSKSDSDSRSHRDDRDRGRGDRDREKSRHDRDDRDGERRRSSKKDDDYRHHRDRDDRRSRDEDYRRDRERDEDRRERDRDHRGDDRDYRHYDRHRKDDRRDRDREERSGSRKGESSSRHGRESNGNGKEIPLPPSHPAKLDFDQRVQPQMVSRVDPATEGMRAFGERKARLEAKKSRSLPPHKLDIKPGMTAIPPKELDPNKEIKVEPPASPDTSPVKRANSQDGPGNRSAKKKRTDSAEEGEIQDDVDIRSRQERFDAPIAERRSNIRSPVPLSAIGSLDAPPLRPVQPPPQQFIMTHPPPMVAMIPPQAYTMGVAPPNIGFHPHMWANGVPPVYLPAPYAMQQQQRIINQQQMAFQFTAPPPSLAPHGPYDHLCIIPDNMIFFQTTIDKLRDLLQKMADQPLPNGCTFEPHVATVTKSVHGIGTAQRTGAELTKLFDEFKIKGVVRMMREHECDRNTRTQDSLFRCLLGIADGKRQTFKNPKIIFLTSLPVGKCTYMNQPVESKGIRVISMGAIAGVPRLIDA